MNKSFTAILVAIGLVISSTAALAQGRPPAKKTIEVKCGSTVSLFRALLGDGKMIMGAEHRTEEKMITLWLLKDGGIVIVSTAKSGDSCIVLEGKNVKIPSNDDKDGDESNG